MARTIQDLIKVYTKYFYMEDTSLIPLVCAGVLSNRMPGDAVWLMLIGGPSSGKCLGKGTRVMMYDGSYKKVEDIKIGEFIMGDDSTPRKILSLARGKERMYRVTESHGFSYKVNESHILSLVGSSGKDKGIKIDMSVKEFITKSQKFQKRHKGYKVGVEFKNKIVDIDPYYLGLWLGDGRNTNTNICKPDKEIEYYCRNYASKLGMTVSIYKYQDRCPEIAIVNKKGESNKLKLMFNKLGLMPKKFIPEDYKINSREVRLQILAGLLDTDGYLSKSNEFDFINKNQKLARDTAFIAKSLGLTCSINKCVKGIKSTGFTGTYWRVRIGGNIEIIPTKISRKQAKSRIHTRNSNLETLTIKKLNVDNYYGFEIDGNKRFIIDDFTVTHNTELLNILSKVPFVFQLSTLTPNTFLSGMRLKGKETSFLLRIPKTSVITMKDYTSILSMSSDDQQEIMSQLREIYDGKYTKSTGQGDDIVWRGKITLLAGVTEKIFAMEAKFSGMGLRTLSYCLPLQDRIKTAKAAAKNASKIKEIREELEDEFLEYVNLMIPIIAEFQGEVPENISDNIIALADFASGVRSPVEKAWNGDVDLVLAPEMPMRISNQIHLLCKVFMAMNAGVLLPEYEKILYKIALDSIPKGRRMALSQMTKYEYVTTKSLAIELNYPVDTVRKWLVELNALKICDRSINGGNQGDKWTLRHTYRDIMSKYDSIEPTKEVLNAYDDDDDAQVDSQGNMTLDSGIDAKTGENIWQEFSEF
jgi:hypothetical protein